MSAMLAGIIYCAIAGFSGRLFSVSAYPYYNYLADALIHGQFHLRLLPENALDLSLYNGSYFLNWAPFPAVLLMPFVAVFGVKFNDVLFTAVLAGVNIGLVAQLLRRAVDKDILHVSKVQRGLLVLFMALGTVYLTLPSRGDVWQTAQIVAFCCTVLAYLAAFSLKGKKAWFFTGLALACAFLSRPTCIFVGIFPSVFLFSQGRPWKWKHILLNLSSAALPLAAGLGFFLFYNYTRFGNGLETGLAYHQMSPYFKELYAQYGSSSIHYFPINLYYEYLYYPLPLREKSMMGGSLFLLSPLFFAIFPAIFKSKPRWAMWALLASILVTNVPIMLHMSTGWITFGPRYSIDFMVPLLLLTALGMEKWKTKWVSLLILVSITQYFIGTIGFLPFD